MKKLLPFTIEGKLIPAPVKTERYTPHFEVLVALGKDAVGCFTTDQDGLKRLEENNLIQQP